MNKQIVFTWKYIFRLALAYKKELVLANLTCIIASAIYLPVPFIIPSLINEVLLKQPGFFTKVIAIVRAALTSRLRTKIQVNG